MVLMVSCSLMIVKHDKTNITITNSNINDIELKNGYIVT